MKVRGNKGIRRRAIACSAITAALLVAELVLRAAGVVDVPLYDADPRIGYIPRASQSGAFLRQNHWQVNEKSQGSPPWQPNRRTDALLLGDSIVWGGNRLDQPQKLGPALQRALPDTDVWSAAAGSWGVPNEVEYLDRFADVVQASEVVVWVINTGDLNARSQWASELTHPRQHPTSALLYVLQKYGLPRVQAWLPALATHRAFVEHVTRLLPPGVLLLKRLRPQISTATASTLPPRATNDWCSALAPCSPPAIKRPSA